jgi:hypothetical protein
MKSILAIGLFSFIISSALFGQDKSAISATKDVATLLTNQSRTSSKSLAQNIIKTVGKKHGNTTPHPALEEAVVEAIQLQRTTESDGEIKGLVDDLYAYGISLIILTKNPFHTETDRDLCKKRKDELYRLMKRLQTLIKSMVDCRMINRDKYLKFPTFSYLLHDTDRDKNCYVIESEIREILEDIDFASSQVAWICD